MSAEHNGLEIYVWRFASGRSGQGFGRTFFGQEAAKTRRGRTQEGRTAEGDSSHPASKKVYNFKPDNKKSYHEARNA